MIDLKSLLEGMQFDSKNLTFYKPRMASLGFTISTMARTLQVVLTPPIEGASTGFAKEGEKRYDHDNNVYSSFSPEDAYNILVNWNEILDKSYVSPTANDDKYKHIFSLQRQDGKFIQIEGSEDIKSKLLTLRIAIRTNSGTLNYILRSGYELAVFKMLLEHTFKDLIFYSEVIQGVVKQLKKPLGALSSGGSSGPAQASSQQSSYSNASSTPAADDPNAGIFSDMNSDGTTKSPPVQNETPAEASPAPSPTPPANDPFSDIGSEASAESGADDQVPKSAEELGDDLFNFNV